MPHIALPEGLPGISSGFAFRPETAKPMRELAHVLLHGPSTLTGGERELIATYVSSQNDCYFCQTSHGAAAAAHLGEDSGLVDKVKRDFLQSPVSDKLRGAASHCRPSPEKWRTCDRGECGECASTRGDRS